MLALGADEVQALETREVYSRVQLPLPAFLAGSKFRSDFDNDCRRVADLFVLNLKDGADIGKVLAFMKDSVNRTLMSDEEMSDGNLLMLWQDIAANTTSVLHDGFPMELQGPRLNCDKAYCKALPFAGNPDLGGIGVSLRPVLLEFFKLLGAANDLGSVRDTYTSDHVDNNGVYGPRALLAATQGGRRVTTETHQ